MSAVAAFLLLLLLWDHNELKKTLNGGHFNWCNCNTKEVRCQKGWCVEAVWIGLQQAAAVLLGKQKKTCWKNTGCCAGILCKLDSITACFILYLCSTSHVSCLYMYQVDEMQMWESMSVQHVVTFQRRCMSVYRELMIKEGHFVVSLSALMYECHLHHFARLYNLP